MKLKGRIFPTTRNTVARYHFLLAVIIIKWSITNDWRHMSRKGASALSWGQLAAGKDCGESGDWREKRKRKYFATTFHKTRGKQRKNTIHWEISSEGRERAPACLVRASWARRGCAEQYQQWEKHRVLAWAAAVTHSGARYWTRGIFILYLGLIINIIMMNLGELFVI